MTPALAARLLALPPTVRATLAGVPGPGWGIVPGYGRGEPVAETASCYGESIALVVFAGSPWAWWPANPAAAVAAVLDCTLAAAHESLMAWLDNHEDIEHPNAPGLDSDAALSIIEAHAARSQS